MKHTMQEIEAFTRGLKNENDQGSHGPLVITRAEFKVIQSGNVAHGFLIHDDFDATYCITSGPLPKDPIEILKGVIDWENDLISHMLDSARKNLEGIYIDDFFYEWKHLEKVFEKD